MLDSIVHKHLDEMDALEKSINDKIESLVKDLDIDVLLKNPSEVLDLLFNEIYESILLPNMEKAIKLGEKFSKEVKRDGEVVIQDTNNGSVNEGVLNDTSRD